MGLFGHGIFENGKPILRYFKQEITPDIVEGEIIIKTELCETKSTEVKEITTEYEPSKTPTDPDKVKEDYDEQKNIYHGINLRLDIPEGKFADVAKLVNYVKSKFNQVQVEVSIFSKHGEITTSDYEDKITVAIKQAGIKIIVEKVE